MDTYRDVTDGHRMGPRAIGQITIETKLKCTILAFKSVYLLNYSLDLGSIARIVHSCSVKFCGKLCCELPGKPMSWHCLSKVAWSGVLTEDSPHSRQLPRAATASGFGAH